MFLLRRRRRKRMARPASSAISRLTPTPIPALAELLNPGEAELGVGLDEGDEDSGRDEEEAEADAVEVGDVETVAPEDEVVLDSTLYPATE